MGRVDGFLNIKRKDSEYRPKSQRIKDYKAVEELLPIDEMQDQAARCMDCGIPFCHSYGCPVVNVIPEFNDALYRGQWKEGLDILTSTNNFPEFTGRICPAPCETSCVLGINDDPVAIRNIELTLIEKGFDEGYVQANAPEVRKTQKVAVVGSGPAGMAAADVLNKSGYNVTVYEAAPKAGGLLMYGIPDFKLEKWVVQRHVQLMEKQGVVFETGVKVGKDVSYSYLKGRYDAILLAGGAMVPRDLPIPGRDLKGIHFAMDFLGQQNMINDGMDIDPALRISAKGKNVVVIGGGDTGSDCIGTSIRHGAKSVTQIEIMPKPPETRSESTPWPEWPMQLRTSSSHKEGSDRQWSVKSNEFYGEKGSVKGVKCSRLEWEYAPNGLPSKMKDISGSEFELKADLVLLAMGFVGPGIGKVIKESGIELTPRGFVKNNELGYTSIPGIFSAGDVSDGPSLVVRAINKGRMAAQGIIEWFKSK